MAISLQIIQIILSVALIALALLQSKGGGLGSLFGGGDGVYRTRRGVEKTMYQATIGLSVIFFAVSLVSVALL
jgi:preprotein translocase subunit SecG